MRNEPDVIKLARCCFCKEKNIPYNRTLKEIAKPFCCSRCEQMFYEKNNLPAFVIIERSPKFFEPSLCVIGRGLLVRIRLKFKGGSHQ